MPLTISDETLQALRMDETQTRIEIACRLFDAGKLAFGHAAKLAGIALEQMHEEIRKRDIPRYRIDEEYWRQGLKSLERWERELKAEGKIPSHEGGCK